MAKATRRDTLARLESEWRSGRADALDEAVALYARGGREPRGWVFDALTGIEDKVEPDHREQETFADAVERLERSVAARYWPAAAEAIRLFAAAGAPLPAWAAEAAAGIIEGAIQRDPLTVGNGPLAPPQSAYARWREDYHRWVEVRRQLTKVRFLDEPEYLPLPSPKRRDKVQKAEADRRSKEREANSSGAVLVSKRALAALEDRGASPIDPDGLWAAYERVEAAIADSDDDKYLAAAKRPFDEWRPRTCRWSPRAKT